MWVNDRYRYLAGFNPDIPARGHPPPSPRCGGLVESQSQNQACFSVVFAARWKQFRAYFADVAQGRSGEGRATLMGGVGQRGADERISEDARFVIRQRPQRLPSATLP
jgi:hypothetical protein